MIQNSLQATADLVNDVLGDSSSLVPLVKMFVVEPLVSELENINDHMSLGSTPHTRVNIQQDSHESGARLGNSTNEQHRTVPIKHSSSRESRL